MAFGSGAVTKPGTIQSWGGTTAPDGWLMCDGSAISRSLYAELYAVIGTTYGAGNGSTTFNLPNLIGLTSDNVPCKGNGMTLGLTNGTTNYGMLPNGSSQSYIGQTGQYGQNVGESHTGTYTSGNLGQGITTDASKSGIVSSLSSAGQKSTAIIKY